MRRATPLILLIIVGGVAAGLYFARSAAPPGPGPQPSGQPGSRMVEITRPAVKNNEVVLEPVKEPIAPGGDPVAKTISALLEDAEARKGTSAIPAGTRLLSVRVKDGVATVDLSDEFELLNKKGDTTLSLARDQLRRALAQFSEIRKMRVLVEGKLFDDGISGAWDDIPVRDDQAHVWAEP